ncbi:hypothetical protein VdG1_05766 [Verticillium dahliae VDG1]|nr:hypothetical protein VdG1_05766 [Verticillium dahliae VDG1]
MAASIKQQPLKGAQGLDIRVEDYLDDKLQSTTDLESLETLLANVETQRSQLQAQLDNAVKQLDEARFTSRDRQTSLETRIQDFQELQHSIDIRVKVAAASDAPNQAIARLQEPMKKLRTVELAQKYLVLLQDVDALRKEARSHLPESPKAALEPYAQLKQLSVRLAELSGIADDAAVHLVNYVETVTETLWDEMKKTMSAELDAILAKRSWPMGVEPSAEMDDEWLQGFEKLIDLQIPEVVYSTETVTLLPFDVMCKMFISEFRYHFMSDKPTSKPEALGTHCFPWFLATIEKWEDFFRDNLGHMLAAKLKDTPAANNTVYIDPVCALVTTMLPVLREKVHTVVADAVNVPTFLSSLIGQLMTFDDNIRARFSYDGGNSEDGWAGLTTEVLDQYFEPWFVAEKEFALERFQAIMAAPDARNIDYDYTGSGKTKPTHGATRVTDLLRSITAQYERARNFKHKMRFLIGIQLDILDDFHDRLRGSLEAYQSITSAVGRTLHGVTKEQLAALEGTGALETLCKVYGSSDHVVNTLKDWSNEDFFVTLWDELQTRAKPGNEPAEIAGDMSYEEVKDRTSTAVGSDNGDGILFDETIAAYALRRKAAQDFLVGALSKSHNDALKAYSTKVQWTTISDNGAEVDSFQLAITAELDEPLRILRQNLDFLVKALSTAAFRRTWRAALDKLQDFLWGEAKSGGGVSLKVATDRIFTDNTEAKKMLEALEIDSLTPANARHILQRRLETNE